MPTTMEKKNKKQNLAMMRKKMTKRKRKRKVKSMTVILQIPQSSRRLVIMREGQFRSEFAEMIRRNMSKRTIMRKRKKKRTNRDKQRSGYI
jgi:hypothetical protein